MKDVYKYGFWFLFLTTITAINLLYVLNSKSEKEIDKNKIFYENRITSLLHSNNVNNRIISSIEGIDIITDEISYDLIQDSTIVILLDDFKCDKCQEQELKRLNSLYEKFTKSGINTIGITTKKKKSSSLTKEKS